MKKIIATLAMFLCLYNIYSQTTVSFCASVDPNGYCIFNNNKFFLSPDSTSQKIFMEVKSANTFAGINKIVFKIYSVSKSGVEKYESMADQEVHADWMFAWVPHIFPSAGKYNVKIYNDQDQLICSKALEIFDGK